MKKKTNDSIKSKYIFIFLLVICFALIFLTFTTDVATGPFKAGNAVCHYAGAKTV